MIRIVLAKLALLLAATAACPSLLFAASGTWTGGSGNWSDPANWAASTIADGADSTAAFAPATELNVTVDTARTIGTITHSGTARLNLQSPASGPLTLQTSSGAPIINNDGLQFLLTPLAGTQGFIKRGGGRLVIQNAVTNILAGDLVVTDGELRLDSAGAAIPAVTQITAVTLGGALRLHYISTNLPLGSAYAPTLRLSGYGLTNATFNAMGALFSYGTFVTAAVNDIVLTPDAGSGITRIGVGAGAVFLELRGTISGNQSLEFLSRAGTVPNAIHVYGSNTYAGDTRLTTEGCDLLLALHGPQRLPQYALVPIAGIGTDAILDLNGNSQICIGNVTCSDIVGGGRFVVRSTGAAGTLTLDANNYSFFVYNPAGDHSSGGGTFRVESGFIMAPDYCGIASSGTFEMVGGELWCPLEIMPGHAFPGGGTVTVSSNGILRPYVTRIGDAASHGIVNVVSGGVLRTSAIHSPGHTSESYLYFNGGTLSDGDWPEWNYSLTNWIQGLDNVFVQAGGAIIEVNGERTIARPLKHDPALGATHDGGLMKIGPGTLHLSAANTYDGPTVITNGVLALDAPDALPPSSKLLRIDINCVCDASLLPSSELAIADGRTLAGNGTLIGSLALAANGAISPGASIGILNVTSNVAIQSGALYQWEIGAAGAADLLSADGSLSLAAAPNAVTVHVAFASTPDETNTYTLASALGGINGSTDGILMDYGMTGLVGPPHPSIEGTDLLVQIVVPEPGVLAAAIMALALCARRNR